MPIEPQKRTLAPIQQRLERLRSSAVERISGPIQKWRAQRVLALTGDIMIW